MEPAELDPTGLHACAAAIESFANARVALAGRCWRPGESAEPIADAGDSGVIRGREAILDALRQAERDQREVQIVSYAGRYADTDNVNEGIPRISEQLDNVPTVDLRTHSGELSYWYTIVGDEPSDGYSMITGIRLLGVRRE